MFSRLFSFLIRYFLFLQKILVRDLTLIFVSINLLLRRYLWANVYRIDIVRLNFNILAFDVV